MGIRSIKINHLLIIQTVDKQNHPLKTVYINYVPVVHFHVDDEGERKLATIELVERGICNRGTAGKVCGFHRNTVYQLLQTKKYFGIEEVLKDNRGVKKGPVKYIGKIRSHIKKRIRKYPDHTDQMIADEASRELETTISRVSVNRIRNENEGGKKEKGIPIDELIDIAKAAESIDVREYDRKQLSLNFEQDKELREKAEEFEKEPPPEVTKATDKSLVERLTMGERNAFAGGFMHHLFLQEIGFHDFLSPLGVCSGATYQRSEIMETLFHSIQQGIGSIEQLKIVNASELGVLMGLSRSAEKDTMRSRLKDIGRLNVSGKLIDDFAVRLLNHERIDREVFFIDGHFLPYYGLQIIAKGYHTVRRLAMRGNELYVVSDLQGRPLYFVTESNEIDFRPIISLCCKKLIEFGIERPIMVFDRGGYGICFFKTLSEKADFITWAKHISEKALKKVSEDKFNVCVISNDKRYLVAEQMRRVKESITTAKKEGRKEAVEIELRMVILKDINTGERIGIYTNNLSRSSAEIAYYMLQRWGDSENLFKEMMKKFYLNYHPGYDIKELESQPLVDNPDIELIKHAIKVIKKDINELGKEKELLEARLIKRKDRRIVKKLEDLEKEIKEREQEIEGFRAKLETLPEKVSIIELLKGKPMSRCDLEKKKLYDLMQFMAYHSRERLVEIFRQSYNDKRDVKVVLDMITRRAGYLKLIGQTLVVILDWIENKKHREAAEHLCRSLNEKGIRMNGRLNVKLFFYVSRIPHCGNSRVK